MATTSNETNSNNAAIESSSQTSSTTNTKSGNYEEISLNTPFKVDGVSELTITNVEFTYDVLPDNPQSFYTHYPADPEKVYLSITATAKNLAKQEVEAFDLAKATVIYDDGYSYDCLRLIQRRGDLDGATYENIDPLVPQTMKYIVQLPENVQNDGKPIKVEFIISGKKFVYNYR